MKNNFVPGTPAWVESPFGTFNLQAIIMQEAQRTGIPTILLSAMLKQESGFNANAGSVAGARGVAQFIASTARLYGLRVDDQVDERLNPLKAIPAMATMMSDLIRQHGTVEKALSAYNSGNPERYLDPNFKTWYGTVGETHKYVQNITKESGLRGKLTLTSQIPTTSLPEPTLSPPVIPKPTPPSIARIPTPKSVMSQVVKPAYAAGSTYTRVTTPTQPVNYSVYNPNATYPVATVKKGETLWSIAQRVLGSGARWKELQGYSGEPRKLPIGTNIYINQQPKKIPVPSVASRYYG